MKVCILLKTMKTVLQDLARRFGTPAPTKRTILRWEQKLFLIGSMKDKARTRRLLTRSDSCAEVQVSGQQSPIKSLRKQSAELQISKTTTLTLMAKDLQLRSFRLTFVNELSDNDREKRRVVCGRFLHLFRTIAQRSKVFFFDACAIYRSSRSRNIYFGAKKICIIMKNWSTIPRM